MIAIKLETANRYSKEQSDQLKAQFISADLTEKIALLEATTSRGWIDLNKTEAVKLIAGEYVERCRNNGTVPTVMGLSAALGISRQWLNEYMRNNPTSETTRFFEVLKELFADALTQAALYRHTAEAISIFILKNTASMADKLELEAKPTTDPMGENMDAIELAKRIEGSVVDDYDMEE